MHTEILLYYIQNNNSGYFPSVLWHCWLGDKKLRGASVL